MTEAIVIRLTGDSGDGVQLVGEQLTITAALAGHDVRTLPDFPAEIRAPAGTVAGVSGFQLAMAEQAIFTAGEELDVLVALNPAALKHSQSYLKPGGLLILNEDSLQPKDWEKAGLAADTLPALEEQFQVLTVPLVSRSLMAVEALGISNSQAKKTKNFYVLGIVLWLFDLKPENCLKFIQNKFKKDPLMVEANSACLMAGYNYAMTLELSRQHFQLKTMDREEGQYRQITGVEAVALALATLAVQLDKTVLVSGYPITPASAILHEAAKLQDFGLQLFQAEDEIAAICACIGASFGGSLALTCTSGPGLDLKAEGIGLAVVTELPLVVVDVQRAGASTGLPTKTGQSDLLQAVYGRHGESPLPVIAARSASDCFYTLIEAFRIAIRYMTPVIVLLDAYLANAAEPWLIPDPETLVLPEIKHNRFVAPYQRDEHLSRSWNLPGTPGFIQQIGGLEKQGDAGRVSYDADNHQAMVDLRANKIAGIAKDYPPCELEGNAKAKSLLISWGSSYGVMKDLLQEAEKEGLSLALLHLRHVNPLPLELPKILAQFEQVIVAELNTGHLASLIQAQYLVKLQRITQTNGQSFTSRFLLKAIRSLSKAAVDSPLANMEPSHG